MNWTKSQHRILLVAALLLLIAASRILNLGGRELNDDEIWAIWRTFGSPVQIVRWVPYDWPPLYYLILGAWKEIVGFHPTPVRMLSVLASLLGAAFTYRFMLRQHGARAALFAMLVFGALSYSIFLSVYLRGYILVVAALPAALWLTVRYFDRPTRWRGIALGLLMAGMFYTYLTSAVAFVVLGVYTLVVYRRAVWRWWLPALVALPLALPLIAQKLDTAVGRVGVIAALDRTLPPLGPALWDFYSHYGGDVALAWVPLFGLGSLAALWMLRREPPRRRTMALFLLGWVLIAPVVMYALDNLLDFFSPRYSWWIMIGCTLWTGLALASLPRLGRALALAALVVILFAPVNFEFYSLQGYRPFVANLEWLRGRAQAGDAILLDTNCGYGLVPVADPATGQPELDRSANCGTPEQWHYFVDVYFPNGGLHFITEPGDERRIWYVKQAGWHDTALEGRVRAGRVEREFIGPWDLLFMLYEAPPDPDGIPFENGMRFHGVDFLEPDDGRIWTGPLVRRDDETLRMRLWWSVDRQIDFDYSVSVQMQNKDGGILFQSDGAPFLTDPDLPGETSRWNTGRFYIEEREIFLEYRVLPGAYNILLTVYNWADGTRVAAPGVNDAGLLPLRTLYMQSH